jgi:hypothetical protein
LHTPSLTIVGSGGVIHQILGLAKHGVTAISGLRQMASAQHARLAVMRLCADAQSNPIANAVPGGFTGVARAWCCGQQKTPSEQPPGLALDMFVFDIEQTKSADWAN